MRNGMGRRGLRSLTPDGTAASVVSLAPSDAPTDLLFWYDLSDNTAVFTDTARTTPVSADGQSIAGVSDLSGVGLHLSQATAAAKPTWKTNVQSGLAVARYDGSDFLESGAFAGASQPITILAVYKMTDSSPFGVPLADSGPNFNGIDWDSGGISRHYWNGVSPVDDQNMEGDFHLFEYIADGPVNSRHRIDTRLVSTGLGGSGDGGWSASTLWLGEDPSLGGGFGQFIGDWGEVAAWERRLSGLELDGLRKYFTDKWF